MPLNCNSWELRETVLPTGDDIAVSESLFSIGNGVLGIRGYPEETTAAPMSSYRRNPSRGGGGNEVMRSSISAVSSVQSHRADGHASSSSMSWSGINTLDRRRGTVPPCRGGFVCGFVEERLLSPPRAFSVGASLRESFLVRVPDAFSINVFVGGEHVSAATGFVAFHTRVLDLRTGELRRRMVWQSPNHNREVTIETSRFASAARKNHAAVRYTVTARNVSNTDIRIVSRTELLQDTRSRRSYSIESVFAGYNIQEASSVALVRTRNSCRHLAVATWESCRSTSYSASDSSGAKFLGGSSVSVCCSASSLSTMPTNGEVPAGTSPAMGMTFSSPNSSDPDSVIALAPKCWETDAGTETIFTSCITERTKIELVKYVGYFSDADASPEDLCDLATEKTREIAMTGYDSLRQEHHMLMSKFWEVADVRYRSSSAIQGAFRFNIRHIAMSVSPYRYHGFPARGLASESCGGLHEWEVDALIIPFFSHVYPEKARTLLQFRIDTLLQAKDNAQALHLPRGALFPLRTNDGGEDPTPYFAVPLFVNAVIAFALRQYVVATNDNSILSAGGAELLFTTALVWLEWGLWDKGTFHLRSTCGPDQYSGIVDNNFFTNLMAQHHMQWAVQVAAQMRDSDPPLWAALLKRCNMTDADVLEMEQAALHMALFFDATNRVHPVDQSFLRRKKWTHGDIRDHSKGPLSSRYHPNVITRYQVCKLSDVVLAIMMLPDRFTADEAKADFLYYEPITTNDSSLSTAVYGVVASQLRLHDKAMHYFKQSLFMDIDNIRGSTAGGLHSNTAACSWWTMAAGFCGMRVVQGVIHLNPTLPDECDEYEFKARHRGCLLRVHVTPRLATYELLQTPPGVTHLLVIHAVSSRIHLHLGVPEGVRLFREIRVFDFDCVIFELDSIIEDIEVYHYEAWKQALEHFFHEMGRMEFIMTKELYLAYLSHRTILTGLNEIMKKYSLPPLPTGEPADANGSVTLYGLCNIKLRAFRKMVVEKGLHFREGAIQLISDLRQSDISVGCVTGSKNGMWILNETPQLKMLFDCCLDGNEGAGRGLRWRPEMDYFEACAKHVDAARSRTIIVMDGIDGFSTGSIERFRLLVDVNTEPERVALKIPQVTVKNFREVTVEYLDDITAPERTHHGARNTSQRKRTVLSSPLNVLPMVGGSSAPTAPSDALSAKASVIAT